MPPPSLQKRKRLMVVLGTSSIVDEVTHEPILPVLSMIVDTAIRLRRDGHRVVLVSSGAIGVGLQRMNIATKPKHLPKIQALAAIGQCRLMSIWDSLFAHYHQPVAQILLTRENIADRSQYINAQNTLSELLNFNVIPIVNENDTLAVAEIKFGDNDTLSAITSAMVHADYLFLLTDVECLYDKNPRKYPDANPISVVDDINALQADVSSAGSALGTGGMATKIVAARLATSAGVTTIITKSSKPGNVSEIIRYLHPPQLENGTSTPTSQGTSTPTTSTSTSSSTLTTHPPLHTRFLSSSTPIRDRRFWILHALSPTGTIHIDRGAYSALQNRAGLLPVGIVSVSGSFAQQECVRLVVVDRTHMGSLSPAGEAEGARPGTSSGLVLVEKGEEVGRAVVNFSASEVSRIKGLRSAEVVAVLGYQDSEYVALRENISLKVSERTSRPQTPGAGGGGFRTPDVEGGGGTPSLERSLGDLRMEKMGEEAPRVDAS